MQLSITQLVLVSLSLVSLASSAPVPSPETPSDSSPRIEVWRRSPTPEHPSEQEWIQKRSETEGSEEAQKAVSKGTPYVSWSAVVPPNRVNRNPDYILL